MQKLNQSKTKILHKLRHVLILCLLIFATGCTTAKCDYPAWPVAGKAVATELDRLNEKDFPALYEWLARLEKLRDQLN